MMNPNALEMGLSLYNDILVNAFQRANIPEDMYYKQQSYYKHNNNAHSNPSLVHFNHEGFKNTGSNSLHSTPR